MVKRQRIYWSKKSDEELLNYARAKHKKENLKTFSRSSDSRCYQVLQERDLIEVLIKEGNLIRESWERGHWKNMSDWNLIHYMRSNHYGHNLSEIQNFSDYKAYGECRKRKIKTEDDRVITIKTFLIEEETLMKPKLESGKWSKKSNEEFMHYMRSNYYGSAIFELRELDSTALNQTLNRKLMDLFIDEGTLLRDTKKKGSWKELENITLDAAKFFQEHPEYKILPGSTTLRKYGFGQIAKAAHKYHGGMPALRAYLAEKMGIHKDEDGFDDFVSRYMKE